MGSRLFLASACGDGARPRDAARRERLTRWSAGTALVYDVVPALVLALPPFALTAGLFLLIRRVAEPAAAGYALLPLINALGRPARTASSRRP